MFFPQTIKKPKKPTPLQFSINAGMFVNTKRRPNISHRKDKLSYNYNNYS